MSGEREPSVDDRRLHEATVQLASCSGIIERCPDSPRKQTVLDLVKAAYILVEQDLRKYRNQPENEEELNNARLLIQKVGTIEGPV